jgi:hypothetical protein
MNKSGSPVDGRKIRGFFKVLSKGYASVCFMRELKQRHALDIENTGVYFEIH